jgi:putative nucleotidyltransferase with HDIG domain
MRISPQSALRDLAFAAIAIAAPPAAYVAASATPSVAAAAVVTASTAFGMHARLALGRWLAAALVFAGAALVLPAGAPQRLVWPALLGGLLGGELVARASRRAAILQAGLWAGLAAGLITIVSGLFGRVPVDQTALMWEALGAAAGGFLGAPVLLTLGPVAEWLFGHTTRLTLGEWLNHGHPLLRELASKAPGTFQHSINVAVLADAAAVAVGADALLAHVGGLYHDVGKMRAPEFFVENQGDVNPHDRLDPRESARILRAHVSDGVKLVHEHHMGERIADFVREHHGTGTMRLLKEKAESAGSRDRKETYRYEGPRPRSRETGIVMIADQLEATARAAERADHDAFDAMVCTTVDRIRGEEQLADSGLGAADLRRIRPALVRALLAMHHRRLTYPPSGTAQPTERRRLALVPRMLARGRGRA